MEMHVTLPRWLPCQYMVKNTMNILSRNHWADFNETWYESLATQAHYILFKLRPWFDHDLFNGKVKFCN